MNAIVKALTCDTQGKPSSTKTFASIASTILLVMFVMFEVNQWKVNFELWLFIGTLFIGNRFANKWLENKNNGTKDNKE